MKNLLLIIIIALTVACSKDDPEGLKMNSDGIYTITNRSELDKFNRLLETRSNALCILAYPDKESIERRDLPANKQSVYGADLPSCKTVEAFAFDSCTLLTTINLPTCTSVGECAFDFSALTKLYLPECITIGDAAFWDCDSLVSIDLPKCRSIGKYAFAYNHDSHDALESVNLPECTSIGMLVFMNCHSLAHLSLLSMKSITTVPIGSVDGVPNDSFFTLNTKEITLTLNANGVEKDNIENGNRWRGDTWKEIIFK